MNALGFILRWKYVTRESKLLREARLSWGFSFCLRVICLRRCAFSTIYFFCDESGNSGPNYLDPQQPVHALAGWAVAEDHLDAAEEQVRKYRLSLGTQGRELHGTRVLRSGSGQSKTATLFRNLKTVGCAPVFVIAEKRYCVGGKIVETFMDPFYNPSLTNAFSWDVDLKRCLAGEFAKLPEEVISEFAVAYRNAEVDLLRRALLRIHNCLLLQMRFASARALLGCLSNVERIADAERPTSEEVPGMRSLNLPVFVLFLQIADGIGEYYGHDQGYVIHDDTKEFESAFRWIFDTLSDTPVFHQSFLSGEIVKYGFDCIRDFTTTSSHESLMIQAADRLAAFIRLYSVQILTNGTVSSGLASIGAEVLPVLQSRNPPSSGIIGMEIAERLSNSLRETDHP